MILALQPLRNVRSFSFCCYLSFISNRRSALIYRYTWLKKSLNISTLFINQQLVIAVYINYGSRPSLRCVFMFHRCITSWDVKYLLWHVPVTLISPINRCNILLPWKIAGKCDQSAGCRRQPAAILNPVLQPLLLVEVWALYYYPLSFQPNLSLMIFLASSALPLQAKNGHDLLFFSKAFEPILRHALREKTLWFVSWHTDIHVTPEWQDLSTGN